MLTRPALLPRKIANLFTPYKVNVDSSINELQRKLYANSIMIPLPHHVRHKMLPYSDVYTDAALRNAGLERFAQSLLVARADRRSPQEILNAGGFHPQATNPDDLNAKCSLTILDVMSHRDTAKGSGLVSFSSSMQVVMTMSSRCTYLVKVLGAIGPHAEHMEEEKEYSVPGGVDAEDIAAFRIKMEYAPIFVSNAFLVAHPEMTPHIIAAYLREDEWCMLDEVKITQQDVYPYSEMALINNSLFSSKQKIACEDTTPDYAPQKIHPFYK